MADDPTFILIDDYNPKANPKNLRPASKETRVPDSLVDQLKSHWLDQFERLGLIDDACEAIGVSPGTVWKWRKEDPGFGERWDYVRRHRMIPLLEDAMFKRALSGKSDLALIALLKNLLPEKYDEKTREKPAPAGIQIAIVDVDGKSLGAARSKAIDDAVDVPVIREK